jgi:uncharacterized protein with HEPN domain
MPRDSQKFLNDIRERATYVVEFMADKSLEDLTDQRLIRSSVERELMVLGEALYQLHRQSPAIAEQISAWRQIIGFRHVLVHGYDSVDMQVIWDAIQNDLAPLIAEVTQLMAKKT